jgi:hypothetical protein
MDAIHYTTTEYDISAKLSLEKALTFMSQSDIDAGEKRGQLKTRGMWQLPVNYRAIAVDVKSHTIYGMRTLTDLQQLGYELEGRVCVNGKRVRAFTSTLMIELPNKRLINVAIIYCCMDQPK